MVIEVDDEVFFIVVKNYIWVVMSELCGLEYNYKKIIIVGGGNIGECLCDVLEGCYQVKIIECSIECCIFLVEKFNKIIVICGNVLDQDLLFEESVEDMDIFIVVINDDEVNIMLLMFVKWLGVCKVMMLINNLVYVDLVQGGDIDIVILLQ